MSGSFRLTGQFKAYAEGGETYTIHEYQEFIESHTMDGVHHIPGMKELRLNDGSRVTTIDENTFEIVQSGAILKRAS
jgi:hypothetical protein